MSAYSITDYLKAFGLKQAVGYMDKDPDANIPKLLDWLEKHDLGKGVTKQVAGIRTLR
jgi:hypothetical protein